MLPGGPCWRALGVTPSPGDPLSPSQDVGVPHGGRTAALGCVPTGKGGLGPSGQADFLLPSGLF